MRLSTFCGLHCDTEQYGYFSSVVTDFIYGNDTIDKKESLDNI